MEDSTVFYLYIHTYVLKNEDLCGKNKQQIQNVVVSWREDDEVREQCQECLHSRMFYFSKNVS